ncbi:hypothetical protein GUJ93_ZPchr0001g30497 [Zizania palustris]|uniref:Uncharacterized protein n=1 Tax=Zizania palustris TaxID=103762 RepID=A0A8J5R7B2_ZIZPA|nr:hypothetical protein GUJ93_ZPchr0001g30497 [Zizania palustris]
MQPRSLAAQPCPCLVAPACPSLAHVLSSVHPSLLQAGDDAVEYGASGQRGIGKGNNEVVKYPPMPRWCLPALARPPPLALVGVPPSGRRCLIHLFQPRNVVSRKHFKRKYMAYKKDYNVLLLLCTVVKDVLCFEEIVSQETILI